MINESKISFDTTEKYYKINKTEIKHNARLKNQINREFTETKTDDYYSMTFS